MLDDRKKKVLQAIVEEYINTAEPVSSNALISKYGLECSSATIRNEMADLEKKGLLDKMHTSSGRIPSAKGYRYYVDELLKRYGLGEFKASRPSELSGGMRQRAALIRTLALEPEILLLDEPFSALDYQTRLTVCDDIYSIIKKEHKTAVLVTHDLSEAISVGDTVYVLSRRPGRIARSVSVDFPADLTPLMRRNAPEFKDYFNILWKELNENG